MRRLLLLTFLLPTLGLFSFAKAQTTGGIKVGGNAAFFSAPLSPGQSNDLRAGFVGGAFLSMPLSERWAVQPEVQYTQLGSTIQTTGFGFVGGSASIPLRMDQVQVPILLKYFIVKNRINLHLGPHVGFITLARFKYETANSSAAQSTKALFKSSDYGFTAGIGANLPLHLTLDLRYVGGLRDLISEGNFSYQRTFYGLEALHQRSLQVLLGLRLF